MAGRREKCHGCGVLLLVPPEAQTIRCAVCLAVNRVRPHDPFDRAQDSVRQAANRMKQFVNTVSTKINAVAASPSNNYSSSSTVPFYGHFAPLPQPLLQPSSHGKKRAVLCGVTYKFQSYELKGTVNDVNCMRYFLTENFGFPNDSVLVLSEDERDPRRIPTKRNIRMALQWLVDGCRSGDSLVFHYSGHGSQRPDYDGDEVDGYDETLWPVDFKTEGTIVDDEINATIVRPLLKGVTLHAFIDACHSGTVLDLPFLCRMNREGRYQWENQLPPSGVYKGTSGGLAISFSACDDNQTSVDTSALSGNVMTGAMTYSFIQAAQSKPRLTYGDLLNAMRHAIREAKAGVRLNGPISSLLRKVFQIGLSQEPQLSSSERFDIYAKPFVL